MSAPTKNYSLYAIPAFWAMGMAPHLYAIGLMRRCTEGYFNQANPKGSAWKSELYKKLPQETLERVERAYAAHYNNFENMAIFSAALVLGNAARLPAKSLNRFARTFLIIRALYTLLYVHVSNNALAHVRIPVLLASVLPSFYMIIRAGKVLSEKA